MGLWMPCQLGRHVTWGELRPAIALEGRGVDNHLTFDGRSMTWGETGQDKGKGVHENEFQKSTYVRDATGVNRPRLDRVCDSEEGGGRVIPRGNTSRQSLAA